MVQGAALIDYLTDPSCIRERHDASRSFSKRTETLQISSVWVHERGVMCCAHTLDTYSNLDLTAGLAGRWT
jgi:hypothetical protein